MGPRTRLPATFTATGDPLKDSTNLVQTRDRKPRDVAAAPVNKSSGASGSGVSPHTAKPLTTSTTAASRVVVSPGPADDPHSGPTHLHLPKALHESQVCAATHHCRRDSLTSDERHDHPASTTAALATLDSHSSTTLNQRQNFTTLKSESKAKVKDLVILTDRDDDDDDDVGEPRKRRRTATSWAVSDSEEAEDNTFQVMHSKPQYSTPYFDGPSNPPNAASGQDGPSVSAATIGAQLERVEIQLARLVDVLTAPSLDNIKSDVGSAKIFVSTPFLCKHHGAAPCSRDVKHRAFYKVLMRHLSSALMQGRSELEDHIKRAQGDSLLLGKTMKSWYKNLEVTITDEHVCWWRVLWQAVKQPDRKATVEADLTGNESHKTANVPGSRSNSFAEKVNHVSSTLAEIAVDAYLEGEYKHGLEFDHQSFLTDQLAPVMPRHDGIKTSQPGRRQNSMQIFCLEVVENPDHEISFASLVEGCLQADQEAAQNPKSKKKKKKTGD
ncbi:BQ5605_C032g11108 [Microbotryum silenes-dioicae]|uniref:BQ5605_C032g11108 protein n=1 Tax=Microbotryum silenes-dioicae TaxID=796604 RepID=A0A2X0PHQ0_9BASI|nr:BQ5605_C032g11108 [Microbotryum silenes-dioicae]